MTKIDEICYGDEVLVHGHRAVVLRRSNDAFLIRYIGKDGKPYGGVQWHHISHLSWGTRRAITVTL